MDKKISPGQLKAFHKYSSILALGLIAVFIAFLFQRLILPRMDFYNELWAPAYLLVHGQSPYDTASLNPVLPAVWFPMAIGFFFPLGWLSENAALQAWFIFNILEICVIVFLAQGNEQTLYNTAALALLCFFSPFVLNHFNLGQFSITVLLCLMLSAYLPGKYRDWPSAFFLALALSKPQLGIMAVFGLAVFQFYKNGFKGMFRFGMQTLFMALLMSLPLFIAYPAWIPDWLKSMGENYTWLHPSLFSVLRQSLGLWGSIMWAGITFIALGVSHFLWRKFSPPAAMLWTLALTTLVTPYVWSWDFVLLLPIWMHTFVKANWKSKMFLLISYALAWYGMALVQMQEGSQNQSFWWVPLWFIGTLAVSTFLSQSVAKVHKGTA
jgi:hypothetical protein